MYNNGIKSSLNYFVFFWKNTTGELFLESLSTPRLTFVPSDSGDEDCRTPCFNVVKLKHMRREEEEKRKHIFLNLSASTRDTNELM